MILLQISTDYSLTPQSRIHKQAVGPLFTAPLPLLAFFRVLIGQHGLMGRVILPPVGLAFNCAFAIS